MKLLGTVAHSRCTVMRLSSRMVPEPLLQTQSLSQAAAMASRALSWAQFKDRFALWHREELPNPPHCCCFCKTLLPSGPKHWFVSGLQGQRACEREKRAQHGKGKGQDPPCSGSPAASPAQKHWISCAPPEVTWSVCEHNGLCSLKP